MDVFRLYNGYYRYPESPVSDLGGRNDLHFDGDGHFSAELRAALGGDRWDIGGYFLYFYSILFILIFVGIARVIVLWIGAARVLLSDSGMESWLNEWTNGYLNE